jgi:Protein of unknown function (DUF2281)
MNAEESLFQEIEQIPEFLLPEVLNFVQFLKYKHQQENEKPLIWVENFRYCGSV